jgi:hypothetical protein
MTGMLMIGISACYDVEEGYRINYAESPAEFNVSTITSNRGAIGDNVTFSIQAKAQTDIKSIIVSSTLSGGEGTGFVIDNGKTDPFIDHAYGTVQKNTRNIDIKYNYTVSQDTSNVTITFSLIDGNGKKTSEFDVLAVPKITKYNKVILYTNSNSKTDGFSSFDGKVYQKLADYDPVSTANNAVQESLDVIFIVSGNSALLVGPYDGNFWSNMKIRNKTKFKKLVNMTASDFNGLTNASLSYFVDDGKVDKGTTSVSDVKVGDFVGFKTDFASKNSYKYGIIKVNAIHPANCAWYDGVSYMIEMDVVTQIKKK